MDKTDSADSAGPGAADKCVVLAMSVGLLGTDLLCRVWWMLLSCAARSGFGHDICCCVVRCLSG